MTVASKAVLKAAYLDMQKAASKAHQMVAMKADVSASGLVAQLVVAMVATMVAQKELPLAVIAVNM